MADHSLLPMSIELGIAPRGLILPQSEREIWDKLSRNMFKRWTRSLIGPTAPKRKRPRRVQCKIDARHGAVHYRSAAIRRLLTEVTS